MGVILILLVLFLVFFLLILFGLFYFHKLKKSMSYSWYSSYECGYYSGGYSYNTFSFSYLYLLVFFVVFDLEISLLLKLPEQGLMYKNYAYYFIFLLFLVFGYLCEVCLGFVKWNL